MAAENGTMTVVGEGSSAYFQLSHTTDAASTKTITFHTKDKRLDKDFVVSIDTPAAADPGLSLTDITGSLTMGDPSNGVYSPTVDISGNATIATAGWIASGNHAVSDTGVKIGTINQSTLNNGGTGISSGAEIVAGNADQTINITEGYNTARTIVVKDMSNCSAATVNSSNVSISSLTHTYDSENGNFAVTASETIAAPTVGTPGYISSSKGTKNSGTATVATTEAEVTVGVTVTGTAKVTPDIARTAKPSGDLWTDGASGAATTTKPTTGAYVQVDVAGKTSTISSVGKVTAEGYGTTSHYQAASATETTVGSNAATTAYIPLKEGAVASGTAEISTVSTTYNSTSGKFDITGSANIPAPTISTEGYVASGVGTVSGATGGATVAASVDKIAIAATLTGTGTLKPTISKNVATNIEASSATTTQPSSGYYVAVDSAANTGSVTATASVTSAGYGTTTSGQYTTSDSSALTVGAAASDVTYVPIPSASFANAGESGVSYTDISSSNAAPVLISGDYLYINKGYTPNVKISLARLVPDAATQNLAGDYILSGYSAYDNDGNLVTGTVQTYDGSYTIE